ncbi:ATP-binding protein [Actinoplanes sp. NPDC048791]|uniref:ATP-binding protein n=1 Tax=Actinoplanes sp. NPDC048791 TaxID=3154623 RepID=UPI0033E0246E
MSNDVLLGRGQHLATLASVIAAGRERGEVLLLAGEPGIGKSALLAAARAIARDARFTVLAAVGAENEMHLPFGGLHQVLAPLIGSLTDLPPVQRDALATALGLSDGPTPDLFLIAEAALALLVTHRSRGPLVLLLDDVQWLDPQSHQILTFIAHRSPAAQLVVVGATRTGHPGLFADAGFPRLPILGVDDEAAEQILRASAYGLSPSAVRRIRHEALGNPLALQELPRAWGDGPPTDEHPPALSARLEHAFAGRVAGLPPATRDALLLAAVGSSNDTRELLAALSAFGTVEPTHPVLQPALLAGLITAGPSSIEFRHPLVRSGVLQRETPARRHAAHHALADALTVTDGYRRTWHRAWSIVGPDDAVADELAATVPDSLSRGAVMSAVSSLERAAQLTSSSTRRGRRLLQAAAHAFGVGRADAVARILREASDVDLSEVDRARVVWLSEALNGDVSADSALVRRLCDSARHADRNGDAGLALSLLLSAALRVWWADSGVEDRTRIVGVLDRLTHAVRDPRHVAAVAVAEPVLRGADVAGCLRSAALDSVTDADALRMYGMAAYGIGDLVLATDLLDRAEQSFRAKGRLGLLPVVLALQLHIRLELGDWSGAVSAGQEVDAVSVETGQALFAHNNVLVEARGMALRGQWQAALELMRDAEAEAVRSQVNDRICLGYQARGTALLSAGRPAAAFACLKRQYDPTDAGYHLRESFGGFSLTAEAAVDCGRTSEARRIMEVLETVAVVTPAPLLRVNLLYARAVLAETHDAEGHYRAAFRHDLGRWPWLRARIELEYGRWLVAAGRHHDAVTHLAPARRAFDRIGAARWSVRAAQALSSAQGSLPPEPGRRP